MDFATKHKVVTYFSIALYRVDVWASFNAINSISKKFGLLHFSSMLLIITADYKHGIIIATGK